MLDLSHRRELDWLARLVAEIHSVAPRFQLLLVGALARDLLLYFGHGLRIERLTMDADFALAVSDWAEFPHMLADDFDFATASAWLLGYDARAALARHSVRFDQVIQRLDSILVRELSPDRESPLVAQLNPLRTDEAIKLLRAFYAGLSGASRP